jgi:hypothetical protein
MAQNTAMSLECFKTLQISCAIERLFFRVSAAWRYRQKALRIPKAHSVIN